jgi:hypothetical protein
MSNIELGFDALSSTLLNEFPNLREKAERIFGSGLAYVLFGSVFNAYIEEVADHEGDCLRVADFINRMAESSDEGVSELLSLEVLPSLLKSQKVLDVYWPHLRDQARRLLWLHAPRIRPEVAIPTVPGI